MFNKIYIDVHFTIQFSQRYFEVIYNSFFATFWFAKNG